jgi:hypothetical protein
MLRFAYKDVGKEREQDAEALPNLQDRGFSTTSEYLHNLRAWEPSEPGNLVLTTPLRLKKFLVSSLFHPLTQIPQSGQDGISAKS